MNDICIWPTKQLNWKKPFINKETQFEHNMSSTICNFSNVHKSVQSLWDLVLHFVLCTTSLQKRLPWVFANALNPPSHSSFCITTRISYFYAAENNFLPFFSQISIAKYLLLIFSFFYNYKWVVNFCLIQKWTVMK